MIENKKQIPDPPVGGPRIKRVGIIGGSGLDDPGILQDFSEVNLNTPYGPTSSVIATGKINGREVAILARHGKDHSIMPTKVPYQANIWALKQLGCTHVLATTACGSLKEAIKPRDFVFIDQFIDFTKHRTLTFHEAEVVHTAMAEPFDADLRALLIEAARELNLPYHEQGTMVTIEGPRFSTRAESRMFQQLGADVINMSTVPEVILAREVGLAYASIAMATDYDCWKTDTEPVSFEMVIEAMKENSINAKKLLLAVIAKI